MNHRWKAYGLGLLAGISLAPCLSAQVPPAPGVPAAAPTKNIWSMMLPSAEQKAACSARLCGSPLGELVRNGMKPVAAMSGGLIGGKCVGESAADLAKDLAKDPEGAEGAAAKIKKSEAEAKARREAARYLGTVDCRYWPDAEKALIDALRTDANECVRYEAALSLGRGCCCTKKIMEALTDSVSGTKKLGPAECSERVKAAAGEALGHCSSVYTSMEPVPEKKGEEPKLPPAAHYRHPGTMPTTKRGPCCKDGLLGIVAQSMTPSASHGRERGAMQAGAMPVAASSSSSERGLLFLLARNQPRAHEGAPYPMANAPRPQGTEVITTPVLGQPVAHMIPVGAEGMSQAQPQAPLSVAVEALTVEVGALPEKPQ